MLCREAAFFRICCGSIAYGPVGIEVLRDPPESVLAYGPQVLVALLHLGGFRGKQLRLAHVHEIGPEMKHERRLNVASVDAVDKIELGVEPCGQAETAPLGGDHQHAEAHAQIARDE